MHHRRAFRTSSAAASSRSARRRLSRAYGRRSPERWPVALSFATAWFRFTPILRTSPEARISSPSASRKAVLPAADPPCAAAKVTSAAYAPRARPDRVAASSSSSNSSSVRRNSTLCGRLPPCFDRRDPCGSPCLVLPLIVSAIPILHGRRMPSAPFGAMFPTGDLPGAGLQQAIVCMDRARSIHKSGLCISCFGPFRGKVSVSRSTCRAACRRSDLLVVWLEPG